MEDRQRFRLVGLRRRRTERGAEVLSGGLSAARLEDALREARHWGSPLLRLVAFQVSDGSSEPDLVVYLEPRRQTGGGDSGEPGR